MQPDLPRFGVQAADDYSNHGKQDSTEAEAKPRANSSANIGASAEGRVGYRRPRWSHRRLSNVSEGRGQQPAHPPPRCAVRSPAPNAATRRRAARSARRHGPSPRVERRLPAREPFVRHIEHACADTDGGERRVGAEADGEVAKDERNQPGQRDIRRAHLDVGVHRRAGGERGEDGGVRDWRAHIAEQRAAHHRAEAAVDKGEVAATDGERERANQGEEDAHRAKRRAARKRDDVREQRDERGQSPGGQPGLQRPGQEGCGAHIGDDVAERPGEQQDDGRLEHVLDAPHPRLHRLVHAEQPLTEAQAERGQPAGRRAPHQRRHRVGVPQRSHQREGRPDRRRQRRQRRRTLH
eukprot:scaffold2489_cov110-Isochrysis_galbana.AAC.6